MERIINVSIIDSDSFFYQGLRMLITLSAIKSGIYVNFVSSDEYYNADCIFMSYDGGDSKVQSVLSLYVDFLIVNNFSDDVNAFNIIERKNGIRDVEEKILKHFLSFIVRTVSEEKSLCKSKKLTETQMSILKLISSGFSQNEISNILHMNVKRVSYHKRMAMRRLGVLDNITLYKIINSLCKYP